MAHCKETITDEGCIAFPEEPKLVDRGKNLDGTYLENIENDKTKQKLKLEKLPITSENSTEYQGPTELSVLDSEANGSEQCQQESNLQKNRLEAGNKVKDVLQKGRDFLKRKFQDYQSKFKSKWDSNTQTSISSGSEASSDENSNGCGKSVTQNGDKVPEMTEGKQKMAAFENKTEDFDIKMADVERKMAAPSDYDIEEDPPVDIKQNYIRNFEMDDGEISSKCAPDSEDANEAVDEDVLAEHHDNTALDDSIQLGEEAFSMTLHAENRLEDRYPSVLPNRVLSSLVAQDSFHSDMTQTSQSTVSSVDALLEDRKVDPEVVLTNLGFGCIQDEESLTRIPLRFLQQESDAKGIEVERILEDNEDLAQLVATFQKQKYGLANHWRFANTVVNAKAFVDTTQCSVAQTRQAALSDGRFPVSVLHPDNQLALAEQGYYDNWSSTDENKTYSEHPKNKKRKPPKELSAGNKRKLYRTSHGSWSLVEDEDSQSRFSSDYSPLSGNSSALMSLGSMSSDGEVTPSWNLHSGKNAHNNEICMETKTNIFLYPEVAGNGLSQQNNSGVDQEKWYTPPSSPSGFDNFDEMFFEKTELKHETISKKSVWSSSTLLDQSLNISVENDCVFESEDYENKVEDFDRIKTTIKHHGNTHSSSANEILVDQNKIIERPESYGNKIPPCSERTDTQNYNGSSFTNDSKESTKSHIKPIILDSSHRRDSFGRKKSVSFKDEDDISEFPNSDNETSEKSVVSKVKESSHLFDEGNRQCQKIGAANNRIKIDILDRDLLDKNCGELIKDKESLNSKLSEIETEEENEPYLKCGGNSGTIVTSLTEEVNKREATENHINELTVHKTEYQIQVTFGDIICTTPCVTEKFKINCDKNDEITWDKCYDEIVPESSNHNDMDLPQCNKDTVQLTPRQSSENASINSIPLYKHISSDNIEDLNLSQKINAESFKLTSDLSREQTFETPESGEKIDSVCSIVPTCSAEKPYSLDQSAESSNLGAESCSAEGIQENNLCNATSLSELFETEARQSEDSNNNCAIGESKFKFDQSEESTYVGDNTIGRDVIKMAEHDQSESLSQKGDEFALPVDMGEHFHDSFSIFAQTGLTCGRGEGTQSAKMVCGHSLDSSSINGASSRSPPHLPERRKLFFNSHHSPPVDETSNSEDFLLLLNPDLGRNQSRSLNVLARTGSAQSDSSGFADVETDNMLDFDLKTISTYMGSSGDSDMTLASSINTVLTRNLQDSNLDPVESSPLSVSTPSKSLTFPSETMDKCVGTDIQGLDLILQVLTPSGEVYHPEQGGEARDVELSTSEISETDLRCDNDTDFGFSIWNEKSCRFHESSYCIIPTLYGSDISLANNDNDSAQDRNGNPTPQKNIVSRYYIDMSPRKTKSKLETSELSLKVEAGKVSLQESEYSSDSVLTTRFQDNLKSFHDELFDVRDEVEMSQDEDLAEEIERADQSGCSSKMDIYDIPEETDYSLCNFSEGAKTESPFGMSTPKLSGKMFSPSHTHELSMLNFSIARRPGGHMAFSQCQAASTPDVQKFKNTEEDEAAIFEYQKLASLVNQPRVTKRRGLNTVTTPRYSGPTHSDHWRALQREQRLVEENRLMQQAVDRYKMELRHLENSFNAHYSKVYDMMTEEERDEIEELQLLRAEVYKEVCSTEKLILGRGTNLDLANQSAKRPLASLDVVHQMIELLKEQMYQRTVVLDLDTSMDQILDTSSSSSLPLSPWEEEVSDLRDEVRREQRIQQRELEQSFEGLKVSLFDEVKKEIHEGTQSLYQELQAKDKKITAMQSEIRQLRRRSLQAEMFPPR